MKTFSLHRMKYFAVTKPNGRKVHRPTFEIVATGLTWADAKARRNQDRTLTIVEERFHQTESEAAA